LTLGDVKYDVLNYLTAHPNIQIPEMSTKYLKKKEKGLGLKIKVKSKGKIGLTLKQIIKESVSMNIEAIRSLRLMLEIYFSMALR